MLCCRKDKKTMVLKNGLQECNCKKKKCERHGKCNECIEYHTNNSKYLPYCKRGESGKFNILKEKK